MNGLLRFRRCFQGLLVLLVAGGFFLNTWVNPWRITGMPWSSERLDAYRDIERDFSRTCKAGLASSKPWSAAVFGSSRVDIGIAPGRPPLASRNAVNLGLNAGLLHENKAAFDYFMSHQERPELVIFFIDAGDLTTPGARGGRGLGDFSTSPLFPGNEGAESWLRYHCGVSALSASAAVLQRAATRELTTYSSSGFRREAERLVHPRQQIAGLYLSTIVRVARNRNAYASVSDFKMNEVRDIIRQCREKNTRLILVMPPNHVLFQLAFHELGAADPWFERDRLALAELAEEANRRSPEAIPVEFWDFQDAHPLNAERLPEQGQMEHWIDLFHFTPPLGQQLLAAILTGNSDYGTRLDPEGVSAHVARVRAELERWARAHPENLDFLRTSLERFQ